MSVTSGRATGYKVTAGNWNEFADAINANETAIAAIVKDNGLAEGRLTLSTGVPVPSGDVTAATTVYYTPYKGNRIALYTGSAWSVLTFSELSIALGSDTANKNYDVFAYINAGVVAIERLVWTNDTTRATALALQDGVWVKSGTTTRRYLGTYRTTGSAGQCEDSLAKRFVWNMTHRVRRPVRVLEATDTWNYTTATYRQANANAANQIAVVVGLAEALMSLRVLARASNSGTSAATASVAIGEDSTSTPATGCLTDAPNVGHVANFALGTHALLETVVPVGYHFYAWLERSTAVGTTSWYGDGGVPGEISSGLSGGIDA